MDGKLWPITFRAQSAKEYLDAQAAALDFVLNADRTILADEIEEACRFIESMREVDTDLLSRTDRDRLWDISRQYGESKSTAKETDVAEWNFWCEAMQEHFAANDLAMIRDALPQLESFQVSMNSLPAEEQAMCHDIFVRAQVMLTLCQPAKDYGWYAPTQGALQHLVNEQEVLQLYLMRDQVAASALVTDLHSVLFKNQEVFGQTENGESFGRTLSIFKKMTATDSSSSLKFTINMISPLYYHGVRINRMSVLAEVLDQLQPKIKGMASRIAGLDEAFCQRLAAGLKGIGIEWSPLLFGTAAQFYSDISDEVERSSHKDLFALIAERCGTDAQAITDYLEKGRLHRLAAEIAEIAVQRFDTEDVRKFYAGIGFLIQGKLQEPYFVRRYERGVLATASANPPKVTPVETENTSESQLDAEEKLIRSKTTMMLDSLRVGEKRYDETLGAFFKRQGLRGKYRIPVARRIVLAFAKFIPHEHKLIRTLGFVIGKPKDPEELGECEVNLNNFTTFLAELDLKLTTIREPITMEEIRPDERVWLKKLRRTTVL